MSAISGCLKRILKKIPYGKKKATDLSNASLLSTLNAQLSLIQYHPWNSYLKHTWQLRNTACDTESACKFNFKHMYRQVSGHCNRYVLLFLCINILRINYMIDKVWGPASSFAATCCCCWTAKRTTTTIYTLVETCPYIKDNRLCHMVGTQFLGKLPDDAVLRCDVKEVIKAIIIGLPAVLIFFFTRSPFF